jgi:hypothetical protein
MSEVIGLLRDALGELPRAPKLGQVINYDDYRKARGYPPIRPPCFLRPSTEEMQQLKFSL